MSKHAFLCGLSKVQRKEFGEGQILSLERGTGNLLLKLGSLRNKLARAEPERLTDFIEIASYVFAADRTTKRGSLILKNMGEDWRRDLRLIIAVRDVTFWSRSEVRHALSEALNFASEDAWQFEFIRNTQPIPLQEYLNLIVQDAETAGGTSVVLFSGGLDSLAGAVHELRHSNRHVVLVSHSNTTWFGQRQRELARWLAEAYAHRVTHVCVKQSLTAKLQDREETQRTRSFFTRQWRPLPHTSKRLTASDSLRTAL